MGYRIFYPQNTGFWTPGHAAGTRGIISGIRHGSPETVDFGGYGAVLIKWDHITSISTAIADWHYRIYVDGVYRRDQENATQAMLEGLREGDAPVLIDILAMSLAEHDLWIDNDTLFAAVNAGNRAHLDWTANDVSTDPDFAAYKIYWDNSREDANADTLLDTLNGIENDHYTTAVLAEQDFSFAIATTDDKSNESAKSSVVTVTINTFPKELDNIVVTYTTGTRKVVITGDVPGGQSADAVGYNVYGNYIPGYNDTQDGLCSERWMALKLLQPAGGSVSYTSNELFAGHFLFGIRAVDESGLESDFTEIRLSLEQDGSDLVEVAERPVAPQQILAVASSSGVINVSVEHDGAGEDPTNITFFLDGAEDNEQAFVPGTTTYTYTTAALNNGQEYEFHASARNGTTVSIVTETVTETADSAAPAVPSGVSVEAIF